MERASSHMREIISDALAKIAPATAKTHR